MEAAEGGGFGDGANWLAVVEEAVGSVDFSCPLNFSECLSLSLKLPLLGPMTWPMKHQHSCLWPPAHLQVFPSLLPFQLTHLPLAKHQASPFAGGVEDVEAS